MSDFLLENIHRQILKAADYAQLKELRAQAHEIIGASLAASDPFLQNQTVNHLHDCLIQRCVVLAETALADSGFGKKPASYAFVLFGSGGRSEQTLWSDQDNGLIYHLANEADSEWVSAYFAALGDNIVKGLIQLGYPPCEGKVICSNKQWCQSIQNWLDLQQKWLEQPTWENNRYLLIMSDMRFIYGKEDLVKQVNDARADFIREHRSVLENLLHNTLHRKPALGPLGNLITERYGEDAGGIDLKYGSYIPLINSIRLLAIQAGIYETSTNRRIVALKAAGILTETYAERLLQVHRMNLHYRSLTSFEIKMGQYFSRGKILAEQLSKQSRQQLKYAFQTEKALQKFVRKKVQENLYQSMGDDRK